MPGSVHYILRFHFTPNCLFYAKRLFYVTGAFAPRFHFTPKNPVLLCKLTFSAPNSVISNYPVSYKQGLIIQFINVDDNAPSTSQKRVRKLLQTYQNFNIKLAAVKRKVAFYRKSTKRLIRAFSCIL